MSAEPKPGSGRVVQVERLIPAPAEAIFAVLADPRQHAAIDGSGSVKRTAGEPPARLALGSRFSMSMRIGLPYLMRNEVTEFEEGRRIAWRHYGHHVWRYTLEPAPGGTLVTEEFDWAPSRMPWMLELLGAPSRNRRSMEATLQRLEELVTSRD